MTTYQVVRLALMISAANVALIAYAEDGNIAQEDFPVVVEASTESAVIDPEEAEVELELVTRGIYQCLDHGKTVFVDQDNRSRYNQCKQIRAPHYQQVHSDELSSEQQDGSPCSGALIYQGGTYIFNDYEPCPIPDEIFQSRKPIQANPEYYSQ